nr:MAG TPA: hypothetical protein [Caudoviricetes sp.]
MVIVSPFGSFVNPDWFVDDFLHLLFLSNFCIIETIKMIGEES